MKPVKQTIFGGGRPRGNCFQACVASIFELPLEEVPHFCDHEGDWWEFFQEWLGRRGLFAVDVDISGEGAYPFCAVPHGAPCILSGQSPRGDFLHAIVGKVVRVNGLTTFEAVHDPHPDNSLLVGPPLRVKFFATLRPELSVAA